MEITEKLEAAGEQITVVGAGQGDGQQHPEEMEGQIKISKDQMEGQGEAPTSAAEEILKEALSGLTEDQKEQFLREQAGQGQGEGDLGDQGQPGTGEGQGMPGEGQGDGDGQGDEESRTWKESEIRSLAQAVLSGEWESQEALLQILARRLSRKGQEALKVLEETRWAEFSDRLDREFHELRKAAKKTLKVELLGGDKKTIQLGQTHKETAWVLKVLSRAGRHVFLSGPAGSGKTTCGEQVAQALGLEFYPLSVGPETMKSDLLGFIDAAGNYHTTPVREAFEKGGLLLLDEMDAGSGASLTVLNALLSNGYCSFPDGKITRHPNFRCVACANTYGRGADRMYVGRQTLDAATLDRFVFRAFDYDEELERRLAGNDAWVDRVQKIRAAASEQRLRVVVSPRASIVGASMLEDGFSQKDVEEALIFKYDETFRRKMVGL